MEVARVDEHVSHETPNLKSIHEIRTLSIYLKWSIRFLVYSVYVCGVLKALGIRLSTQH